MNIEPLTIARAALAWAGAGWPVIELPAGSKSPPPDGRTGAAGVDMTDAEIAAAPWRGNLGIRMRPDTLGLDVDDYGDKPGASTLAQLVATLGPLPPTWRSSNGRPGISGIRLFAVPPAMSWVAGLPGIEIVQRRHRYAVVWPSMHPEGRQYVLVDELSDEPADRIPSVDDLPELPWSWTGYLSRANDDDLSSPSTAVSTETGAAFLAEHEHTGRSPGYGDVIVADFAARVATGHSRHDSMQHALIWAMESARAGIVGSMAVIAALADEWARVMDIPRRAEIVAPYRVTEFDAMIRHAIGKATGKPQAAIDALADSVLGIPIAPGTPTSPPGMPTAWGLEEEHDLLEQHEDGDPRPLVWPELWLEDEHEEREWLVENFWPLGRQMVIWAPAKMGKSELALWVAVHMTMGRHPFTGAPMPPINVGYFDYEMTRDDLRERLDDLGLRDVGDRLRYYLLPAMHALDEQSGGQQLMRIVERDELVAVVIDTFGRTVLGREDEADTVRAFYRHTGMRLKSARVGLLRLDHAGKMTERGQRGSSAKRDDVDVIWQLTRTRDGSTLDCQGSSRLNYLPSTISLDRVVGDNSTSYRDALTIKLEPPPPVLAMVAELDRLDIDPSFGRDRTIAAMSAASVAPGRLTVLSAAIKVRRNRAEKGREQVLENMPPVPEGEQ